MMKLARKLTALLLVGAMVLPSHALLARAAQTGLGGSIVDTNTQYVQERYEEVKNATPQMTKELVAWANDEAISQLVLYTGEESLKNVRITASDLKNGSKKIPAEQVTATFIKSTKAYNGSNYSSLPDDPDQYSEVAEILYQTEPVDMEANSLQPVWVKIAVPKGTPARKYRGTLSVTADGLETPLEFTYSVNVQDAELPDASMFKDTFDIELWQYPYSSAEYYGVDPFSEEHFDRIRSSMLLYKKIGGHAITTTIVEEAWSGQTYSANDVHYPSMVRWTKNDDGSFTYDYTDFDKWVEFNKSLGIGDKIILYSIAPWHGSFTYWEGDQLKYETYDVTSYRYRKVWKDFLEDLISHLMDKGWFEESYIGIDERGFSEEAFDVIDSVLNINGQPLKTAGAMDGFVNKMDFALRVTDLNVGDSVAYANFEKFQELLQKRQAKGYRTTLYSCTRHRPGNFALSAPVESYWSIANAGKFGTAGFLRWAYDAWVKDPLVDASHTQFEPGDCFLIYPGGREEENPESKSSLRLENMAAGVRDVNKLSYIRSQAPQLGEQIEEVYAKITTTAREAYTYLSKTEVESLCEQIDAFRQGVAEVTDEFVRLRENSTNNISALEIQEGSSMELEAGATGKLHAVFSPSNVLNQNVSWESSNSDVIAVSSDGSLTALGLGTVTVTATSLQDASKRASISVSAKGREVDKSAQVAYYSFDSVTDSTVKDEWGSTGGTMAEDAKLGEGKSGKALEITGENQSVTIASPPDVGNEWTVGYWVYSTASGDRNSVLMDGTKNFSFDIQLGSSRPNPGVHVGTADGNVLTFKATIPSNTWTHIAWTQSATEGLSMYVNGVKGETNTWTVQSGNTFTCPLGIVGGTGFTGKIDELKVYNKVLSSGEIFSSMQGKGLNVQENYKQIDVGESWQIVTNLVSDGSDKKIEFESSDPEIAEVDANGIVTAKKRGTVEITVTNKGGNFEEKVQITVSKKLPIRNTLATFTLPEKYLKTIERNPDASSGRRYLGQPDMIMLDDEETLYTVYPKGHGIGALIMQVSHDAGETWEEKTNIPESWAQSYETPTLYKLNLTDGSTKLVLISGRPSWNGSNKVGGWDMSISTDDGETWSEYERFHENFADGRTNFTTVAMASLIQLKDEDGNWTDKWMGVYHDGSSFVNYKTYLTFENGKAKWSEPEPYLNDYRDIESSYQMCEVGLFRSPDGKRIVGLARSQCHNKPATMIYSDDEGKTWSEPVDLPGSLAGERHKGLYDPVSGRLVIAFREIIYDLNKNDQFDGGDDWIAGDWVAWVGTYEDLMEQNDGQYRILLDEDLSGHAKSGDTGYTGMAVLSDGTFIMDTYGHWEESSLNVTNPYTDLCYIRQAKFKLEVIDKKAGIGDVIGLKDAVTEAEKGYDSSKYTAESWEAFQSALRAAQELAKNPSATRQQVEAAMEALEAAKAGLKEAPKEPSDPVNPGGTVAPGATTLAAPGIQSLKMVAEKKLVGVKVTVQKVANADTYTVYRDYKGQIKEIGAARAAGVVYDENPLGGKTASYYAVASASNGKYLKSANGAKKSIAVGAAVKKLKARKYGAKAVRITWKKEKKAKQFVIYRSEKKSGGYTRIKVLKKKSATSYIDKKVKKGKQYFYKVVVKTSKGFGAPKASRGIKLKK